MSKAFYHEIHISKLCENISMNRPHVLTLTASEIID